MGIIPVADLETQNYQIMTELNTSTETTITDETAIGFIPCYNQPFIRNKKGQFVKTLSDDEIRIRKNENTKKWKLKNKDRVKEIQKKSRSRQEYKEKARILKRERYYNGLDKQSIEKYQKSEKGKSASKKAKTKWAKNNHEKIIEKEIKLRDELSDCYVINKLIRGTNLTAKQIRETPELIEIKRIILKTKRLCKTLQNSEQV